VSTPDVSQLGSELARSKVERDNHYPIKVDPGTIYMCAHQTIPALADDIVRTWNKIAEAWSASRIGWLGEASDEAKAFTDRVHDVEKRLFGEKDADGNVTPGILDKIRVGAVNAYSQFGAAENGNRFALNSFADALGNAGPPRATGANGLPVPGTKPSAGTLPPVRESFGS
jgi:hypothetical protein